MEIKGNVDFTITVNEKKQIHLSYQQNIENDLGALAISASLLELMEAHFRRMKEQYSGNKKFTKALKHTNDMLERTIKGKLAMDALVSYNVSMYEDWVNHKEKLKAEKEAAQAESAD